MLEIHRADFFRRFFFFLIAFISLFSFFFVKGETVDRSNGLTAALFTSVHITTHIGKYNYIDIFKYPSKYIYLFSFTESPPNYTRIVIISTWILGFFFPLPPFFRSVLHCVLTY